MKRVELKRIAKYLTSGVFPPVDEKTPFASCGTLPDNGAFSKTFESDDSKRTTADYPEEEGEPAAQGPMSIARKFCFVLSFNAWILYFVVLGWLLPCRHINCGMTFPEIVEKNLSSIWPLTNVESLNVKGLPSLAFLGYSEGNELKLAALASADAKFVWNNSVQFIPRQIQCQFENVFDANEDGIPDCLLSGYNDVYAFNASNGHVFWLKNLPSEAGNILTGFHPTAANNQSSLIGTCGDQLIVLSSKTGKKVSEVSLPCTSPFDIQIVANRNSTNITLWYLVCDYGDLVEAWSFGDGDLLSRENSENGGNSFDFALLYSGSNSGGSIDLGCDVAPVPGGPLLLSWSDRVVMVTPEAIAWERHFSHPLAVASIQVGHFFSKKSQIVAALRNGTDTVMVVMELVNGTVGKSTTVKNREAQSLGKVSGEKDVLVLRSLFLGNYSAPVFNTSDPIPWEETNFALVDFKKEDFRVKDIVTTMKVLGSTLSTHTNGETDLILIKTENGITSYQKYVLRGSNAHNLLCDGASNLPHYIMES